MQIKSYLVVLGAFFAESALADARFSPESQTQYSLSNLVYAQVQFDQLPQSEMRRMVFYAERATRTLQDLVEGADDRSIYEQDKVNLRFRESITRLADAGARSGLSLDQVADFYSEIVFDNFGQEFMQKVGELAGGLEFRTLFRNVATVPTTHENLDDASIMDALSAASQDIQLDIPYSQTVQQTTQVEEPTQDVAGPVAFPNANAIEVAIVRRVEVNNGRWELTIRAGDSLSSIASAIYGDALSYTRIYSANTNVLSNPNVIEVDTLLVLPQP